MLRFLILSVLIISLNSLKIISLDQPISQPHDVPAKLFNDTLYTSGVVAMDESGKIVSPDFEPQAIYALQ